MGNKIYLYFGLGATPLLIGIMGKRRVVFHRQKQRSIEIDPMYKWDRNNMKTCGRSKSGYKHELEDTKKQLSRKLRGICGSSLWRCSRSSPFHRGNFLIYRRIRKARWKWSRNSQTPTNVIYQYSTGSTRSINNIFGLASCMMET